MSALLERTTGLLWLAPWALWLLVPLVLLGLPVRRGRRATVEVAALSALLGEAERLPRSLRGALRFLPPALVLAGLVAATLALARPARRETVPVPRGGIDIVLCLDASSSMTSTDMDRARTRLEIAKEEALEFVRRRPEDRIGLVVFARHPELVCPLTRDHDALAAFLARVRPVDPERPEDATGLGAAAARAAEVLGADAARTRVAVLLTDGEENVATRGVRGEIAPSHAAQLAERLGVRVYAIAIGVGAPTREGGLRPLDTRALEALARRTGGAFGAARDAQALRAIYARIDALEAPPRVETRTVLREVAAPWLLAALVLLVLGRVVPGAWLREAP